MMYVKMDASCFAEMIVSYNAEEKQVCMYLQNVLCNHDKLYQSIPSVQQTH